MKKYLMVDYYKVDKVLDKIKEIKLYIEPWLHVKNHIKVMSQYWEKRWTDRWTGKAEFIQTLGRAGDPIKN